MDYHIYIHNENGGGSGRTRSKTSVKKPETFSKGKTTNAKKTSEEQITESERNTGTLLSVVGKTTPYIAAAILAVKFVAKTTEKAVDLYCSYYTPNSGDYALQHNWENLKNTIHMIKNPISTFVAVSQNELKIERNNARKEMESQLLGGTLIGGNYGRYL